MFGHLRESGSIEADADVVILMGNSIQINQNKSKVDLYVAKNRDGQTGDTYVVFQKNISIFREPTYDEEYQIKSIPKKRDKK